MAATGRIPVKWFIGKLFRDERLVAHHVSGRIRQERIGAVTRWRGTIYLPANKERLIAAPSPFQLECDDGLDVMIDFEGSVLRRDSEWVVTKFWSATDGFRPRAWLRTR
jgi:hypothetical protein